VIAGQIRAAVAVLAGGSGTRIGAGTNKVYLEIGGRPLLWWTLRAFALMPGVTRLVLVVRAGDEAAAAAVVADLAVAAGAGPGLADDSAGPGGGTEGAVAVEVVTGGAARHDSEDRAVRQLAAAIRAGEIDVVAIHDAARPVVDRELVTATIAAAYADGGAIPGLPVDDLAARAEGGAVPLDPDATGRLVRVQTPQAFAAGPLLAAYEAAARDGFTGTDTAACLERYTDVTVRVLPGDPRNIKVTYPADLLVAARLLQEGLGEHPVGAAADREPRP
jgi:2-C-methyl-D-erythritol 4-phosphate cytidylyltransferase